MDDLCYYKLDEIEHYAPQDRYCELLENHDGKHESGNFIWDDRGNWYESL